MGAIQKSVTLALAGVAVSLVIYLKMENGRLHSQIIEFGKIQEGAAAEFDISAAKSKMELDALRRGNIRLTRFKLEGGTNAPPSIPAAAPRKDEFQTLLESATLATNETALPVSTTLAERAAALAASLQQAPHQQIPELQLLTEKDWLDAAKYADLSSDTTARQAFSYLRRTAKLKMVSAFRAALDAYIKAQNDQLPSSVADLKPYFSSPVDDTTLQRYMMLRSGSASEAPVDKPVMGERAVVDTEHDTRVFFGQHMINSYANGDGENYPPIDTAAWMK